MKVLSRLIVHLGSLQTAWALMALLGLVALARPLHAWLGVLLGAAGLSVAAAVIGHAGLRRRLPLLLAHLAALALLLLVGWGRMSALDGRFELTEGVPFDGRLIDQRAGRLYRPALERLQFVQQGFDIDYAPGRRRGATRNRVHWQDELGQARHAVIGDHRPLVLAGHRITTTPNKGFAPVLQWQPDQGAPVVGAVHLPSFPVHELKQSREWTLPDGRAVWVMLHTDEKLIDAQAAAQFALPRDHRLVLRLGDQRTELAPGGSMALPGGRLVYLGLRSWMGYRIAHDPSLPWLLAAVVLLALAMAWHFTMKFFSQPLPAAAAPRPVTPVQPARVESTPRGALEGGHG